MGHWIDGMYYLDHEVTVAGDGRVTPKKVKGFGPAGDKPQTVAPGSPADMVTQGPTAEVSPPSTYQTKIVSQAAASGPVIQTKGGGGDAGTDTGAADTKPASAPAKK